MPRLVGLNLFVWLLMAPIAIVAADERQSSREPHFANDIVPIFNRFGCNSSSCHGKAEGQNGFRLSVFGFDPEADYVALTHESRGRRIVTSIPEQSLLLKKVSGGSPHGGGVRFPRDSFEYGTLRDWIAAGAHVGSPDAPHVTKIRVEPAERVMSFGDSLQLKVIAEYSDGRQADVTRHTRYQSNREGVADVDEHGKVSVKQTAGDVAIMAAYMDSMALFTALVPRNQSTENEGGFENEPQTAIDRSVDAKLKKLHIVASPVCDDAAYLRRVFLDVIGRLPNSAEARAFLADERSDKRNRLIDSLLQRPEYADYWAIKWSDWLRVDRLALGYDGAYAYYKWIRESFAANKPLDQFARDLLLADGLLTDHPAGHFYRVAKDPGDAAAMLSQALLGVRIDCAKCHHHPFDRWSQDDYYGMQAFFSPLGFKATPKGNSLLPVRSETTTHPRTGVAIFAHPLGEPMPASDSAGDRRKPLADWLTAKANPYFARNMANRAWAHFLGRGLIEPIDDVRSTNPPSNPQLLDALASELSDHGFDFQHLIRTIVSSRTYQGSVTVNDTNAGDEQNYSRTLLRRPDAEVLMDMISDATGIAEKFDGVAAGQRATELWDSQVSHYFLSTTGRPTRSTVCECERVATPNVAQILHLLNSPNLESKLSHDAGRLATLVRTHPNDDGHVVEEVYLTYFSRFPSAEERKAVLSHLAAGGPGGRRAATEDLAWTLMNSLEFLFNH